MELTGGSISYGKFIAPFHEFFKFLRSAGPKVDDKPTGLPCFAFRVDISPLLVNSFYIVNVNNWKPIDNPDNRRDMKKRADDAKLRYEKIASRLSKEAYQKLKESKDEAKQSSKIEVAPQEPTLAPEPYKSVSFEEDDINF
jgi:hypothetical protein